MAVKSHSQTRRFLTRCCVAGTAAVAAVLPVGCQSADEDKPVGCGIVDEQLVTDILGADVKSRRTDHGCRVTDTNDKRNFVAIETGDTVDSKNFMQTRCSGGWVFAGTVEKFAPACISKTADAQKTRMISEWEGLQVQVEVGRSQDKAADDAEAILDISRSVAEHVESS